jgi:hypothetical protein
LGKPVFVAPLIARCRIRAEGWMHGFKLLSLFAGIAFCASAAGITGTWKAVFVSPEPKAVSEVILHLTAEGERLRGAAHLGSLGKAPVVDGKVAGDRISFAIYPNGHWRNQYASGEEAGGVTKLIFNGTVQGSDIKFTLIWDSVTLYGKPPVGKEFLLKATKTAE